MKKQIRVRLNDWMIHAIWQVSERTGMDYSNITRMALMEFLEKRLEPKDYESIEYFQQTAVKDVVFEFEHYNRLLKKKSDKKALNFKKLFVIALQNYNHLGHTHFDDYKTDVKGFKDAIWNEPGVIDLLWFMIHLDEIPLPHKHTHAQLLKEGNEKEYYLKMWDEIYNILKKRIGNRNHDNYTRLIEMKIDHHLHSDTEAMYFLFEKLKNNEKLPPSSGKETKRIPNSSSTDEGTIQELIMKYGADFEFNDEDELDEIIKKYGTLGHIDHMIKYYEEGVEAYKDDPDQLEFEKEQLEYWKKFKQRIMEEKKKKHDKKNK